MAYNKIVKKPERVISVGNDKVMVLFEDNTTQYHTVVEVSEYFNKMLIQHNEKNED
jgi:hypothetical protein